MSLKAIPKKKTVLKISEFIEFEIKKIPVFRVTRPYLNLLMKPRIFSRFSGKKKIIYLYCIVFQKKNEKSYVCLAST